MNIDAHTHIFPAAFREMREELCRREPAFAGLYADPRARMATAAELLEEMDGAGIAAAVICGFAWEESDLCRAHNDELLRAAADAGGRLLPFLCLPLGNAIAAAQEAKRGIRAGARGFGELRPQQQGLDLALPEHADLLAALSGGLPLLIHASEPAGHAYPGKEGQSIRGLYAFLARHPTVPLIAAHLGGGLPFYADMPEVAAALASTWFDTAAWPYLYRPTVFRRIIDLVGVERLLFASDFPLRRPARDLALLAGAGLTEEERAAIIGENAARFFQLDGLAGAATSGTPDGGRTG